MGGDNESMKPTLAGQSMVGMTTSILPREGKTTPWIAAIFEQRRIVASESVATCCSYLWTARVE